MRVIAHSDQSGAPEPVLDDRLPRSDDAPGGDRTAVTGWVLLLAALPAVVVGLSIRIWVMQTTLLSMNSDEGITGLQGLEVLHGRFRTVVAGNDYGATTESYLLAPLLALGGGPLPLRALAVVLSAAAAYALFRLAKPLYGRVTATALALIGWTASGALVLLASRVYLGYPTGVIAEVVVLALACHAMRTPERLGRTALWAGVALGFAIWSHPMFGVVALLGLTVPSARLWREVRRWWLPLAAGGVVGISPWLVFMAQEGWPTPARASVETTYVERLGNFATELLPRAFGVRSPDGSWLDPFAVSVVVAAVLIAGSLAGLVLLWRRKGGTAAPIVVAGLLAFPILAVLAPLGYVADARYALPFFPALLMGLGAWSLLLPVRIRDSPWLVATVPTIWAVLLCVPILHQQVGWQVQDPDAEARGIVEALEARQLSYLAGDYGGTYLPDYLAGGGIDVQPDDSIRLEEEAQRVAAADPAAVAYVFRAGDRPRLRMWRNQYERLPMGEFDLYVPVGR
jgi:hypothetical protein